MNYHYDFHGVSRMYRLFENGRVVLTCYTIGDLTRYLTMNGIRNCTRAPRIPSDAFDRVYSDADSGL